MDQEARDAFSEAILDRVAELAYEELRPHLAAYARARQATATTRPTATTVRPDGDQLAARRARRVA